MSKAILKVAFAVAIVLTAAGPVMDAWDSAITGVVAAIEGKAPTARR